MNKFLDEVTLKKAHQYVLFNCEQVKPFIDEHYNLVKVELSASSIHEVERVHGESFASWFAERIQYLQDDNSISDEMKSLARGPNIIGRIYNRVLVNGLRFHTKDLELRRKTQNSGVKVRATTSCFSSSKDRNPKKGKLPYFGVLRQIVELHYHGGQKVMLFNCDWAFQRKNLKQDKDGFTLANLSKLKSDGETFILASQAEQVFYIADPVEKEWHVVIETQARDVYEMCSIESVDEYLQSEVCNIDASDRLGEDIKWIRKGSYVRKK